MSREIHVRFCERFGGKMSPACTTTILKICCWLGYFAQHLYMARFQLVRLFYAIRFVVTHARGMQNRGVGLKILTSPFKEIRNSCYTSGGTFIAEYLVCFFVIMKTIIESNWEFKLCLLAKSNV